MCVSNASEFSRLLISQCDGVERRRITSDWPFSYVLSVANFIRDCAMARRSHLGFDDLDAYCKWRPIGCRDGKLSK